MTSDARRQGRYGSEGLYEELGYAESFLMVGRKKGRSAMSQHTMKVSVGIDHWQRTGWHIEQNSQCAAVCLSPRARCRYPREPHATADRRG